MCSGRYNAFGMRLMTTVESLNQVFRVDNVIIHCYDDSFRILKHSVIIFGMDTDIFHKPDFKTRLNFVMQSAEKFGTVIYFVSDP